jgi:phosphate acetyltransferase
MATPESAKNYIAEQIERVRALRPKKRIVFPEGDDLRVIAAAERLVKEDLAEPILIGKKQPASHGVVFIDPNDSPRDSGKYAEVYFDRRRAKGTTHVEAMQVVRQPLFFAALMVAAGDADGAVGGAVNTTGETFRAGIQCLGVAPRVKTVSSVNLMAVHDTAWGHHGMLAFSDCALIVNPSSVELAEIAMASAESFRALTGAEPIVALLSFSTKGSARHPFVEKVVEALRVVQARNPNLQCDGELQVDAAIVPSVGRSKAPGSKVAGRANTLIFPDLEAGNIGLKLVERLGDGVTFGPFFQGLAKPFNDLSRGCSPDDIYGTALVTALQAEAATTRVASSVY